MKNIVAIGGGTGQGNLLRGLKSTSNTVTAIVTVADDGGGSGILRVENGILPPGDMRNCMLSLSNIDPTLERLMKHRFQEGRLTGQNFGNLFILALSEIYEDMELAILEMTRMLGVQGKIIPVSLEDVHLKATLEDGTEIVGESKLAPACIENNTKINKLELIPENCKPNKDAIEAIRNSDIIILGPGSLYTSILANLLVDEIKEEISRSKALKIYILNIMTEYGETDGFSCEEHLNELVEYLGVGVIDYIIVNDKLVSEEIKIKYENEGQYQIILASDEAKRIRKKGYKIKKGNFLSINDKMQVLHNSQSISKIIEKIYKDFTKK